MPASNASIRMHDHEKGNSFGLHIPQLDSANIDDYTDYGTPGTLIADLFAALAVVCDSVRVGVNISALAESFSPTIPTDPTVRNEARLVLKYRDTVEPSLSGRIEIPGVDVALVGTAGTDEVDMAGTEVAALIAAVEAFAVSKIGNPITVYDALIVGRAS